MPQEDEARCRAYGSLKLLLEAADLLLVPLALAVLTLSGAASALLAACEATTPGWPGHLEFLILVGCVVRGVQFPLHFLSESWLDRRFGLSAQGAAGWCWEWLCRSAVLGIAGLLVLLPVVELLGWWPVLAPLWCVLFLLGRPLFFEWIYYPLLGLFYPVRFLREETFSLPGIGRVTLPVYLVKVSHRTRRANASIRIRGKRSAIYVTDTLIDEFDDGEERVVMAHEFGHLYDQLHLEERTRAGVAQAQRKLVYGSVQLLAAIFSVVCMHLLSPALGLSGVQDLRGVPLLVALVLVFTQALSPLIYAEARRDEKDADEYALAITGDVESYVSVMRKLRQINLEESHSSGLARVLFDTHPSYSERVRLAFEYRRRHGKRKKPRHWRGWKHIQRHGRR
ncbi:MAG: M48 family metallopeptidase [Armatimonadota bacterium]